MKASAPGAPEAHDGFEPRIELWHIWSPNPIAQDVSVKDRRLVNIALPGHVFQGTVTTTVTPAGSGSVITMKGAGDRPEGFFKSAWNNFVGWSSFTLRNFAIQKGCNILNGSPLPARE